LRLSRWWEERGMGGISRRHETEIRRVARRHSRVKFHSKGHRAVLVALNAQAKAMRARDSRAFNDRR
jgi:hypothetical protein